MQIRTTMQMSVFTYGNFRQNQKCLHSNVRQCNVSVEFKVTLLHEQVRYRGTLQYLSYSLSHSWTLAYGEEYDD